MKSRSDKNEELPSFLEFEFYWNFRIVTRHSPCLPHIFVRLQGPLDWIQYLTLVEKDNGTRMLANGKVLAFPFFFFDFMVNNTLIYFVILTASN